MSPILLAMVLVSSTPVDAWPAFRGSGDSVSHAERLPLKWSEDSGIAWRADLTGYGQSSPVVWHDRVFVTSAEGSSKEKAIVACFDLASGRQLWQKDFKASQPAKVNGYISVAAPTPAADADRVYTFFETGDLAALSHAGKGVWQRSLTDDHGKFLGNHGLGSSLALTDDAVIVLIDHDGPSYLLAVDKTTGKTLWKQDRPQKVSWSSPIVADNQVLVSSSGTIEAIDAKTGKQLWSVDGVEGNTVPSATVTDKIIVVGASQVGSNLAIHRSGEDEETGSRVVWRSQEATATFSSPLVYKGHVYMVNRAGVAFCLDVMTGRTAWNQRIGGSCWASPIGACGRVYFFGKSGNTTVVAAGPKLKVLAESNLPTEDRVYGVAAVEGRILIRTGSSITCVSNATDKGEQPDMQTSGKHQSSQKPYPDLPKAITSFGAAVVGNSIYLYGGHHGKAHHYYEEGQSGELIRLDLKEPRAWEVVVTGPRLQGLALVAHQGKLFRIGGFTARNKEDEDQDLWSVAECARFDPESKKWESLPPLPSPRSSFDATVAGDSLYVVGGWSMQGDKDTVWHDTAYSMDLADDTPRWRELAKPPFKSRALAVGSLDGKVYVIGGMQPNGNVTRRTAIFDPAVGDWSAGPELPGEDMEGFGPACCTMGGRLYVSTSSGKLLRLAQDRKSWDAVQQLRNGRFFHRMLALGDEQLGFMGGANMQQGKYASVEAIPVDQ